MAWSDSSGDPLEEVLLEAFEAAVVAMAPTSYKTTPAHVSTVDDNVLEVDAWPACLISQPVLAQDYTAIKADGAVVVTDMDFAVMLIVNEGGEAEARKTLKNFVADINVLCQRNDQWPDTGGACRARYTRVQPDIEYERMPGEKSGVLFAVVPIRINFGTLSTDPSEAH